jgi:DNA mismatch repair protein MutL
VQEESEIVVQGFVSKPEFAKKNRGDGFLRRKKCLHRFIMHMVWYFEDGATKFFLYLTVPPNTIDINIHPTKRR